MKAPLDNNHKPDIFLPLTDCKNSKLLPAFNSQATSPKHRAFKQPIWHSQTGVQPSEICYSNVQNLNVINMNVSHHDTHRQDASAIKHTTHSIFLEGNLNNDAATTAVFTF